MTLADNGGQASALERLGEFLGKERRACDRLGKFTLVPTRSHSFPNSVWERTATKLRFAFAARRTDIPPNAKRSFAPNVPKQSLGTRECARPAAGKFRVAV